jgi:hypothetical protein
MNRLDKMKQAQVIAALVEGNSIRSMVRMTGVAKMIVRNGGVVLVLDVALQKNCRPVLRFIPQTDPLPNFLDINRLEIIALDKILIFLS